VALELLTGPSLLVLDEPTTGLDCARPSVMTMLRGWPDAGRVVVVIRIRWLPRRVDQVLLLALAETGVLVGRRVSSGRAWASTDWADILHRNRS